MKKKRRKRENVKKNKNNMPASKASETLVSEIENSRAKGRNFGLISL